MIYVYPITILLGWIYYSIIEGKREAHYWHHWILSSDYQALKDINLHTLFAKQRGLILCLVSILIIPLYGYLIPMLIFIANACLFSFFHNGMMYKTRNYLNKHNYPKRWWDQSSNSTAWSTKLMTPISRTIQALIGILIYTTIFFLIHNQ